jgi:PadR family transcriptional regulator PadR
VLCATESSEQYGYALVQHLRTAGLTEVADASVYGTLKRLEAAGKLGTRVEVSEDGPPRKYYRPTAQGRRELATLRKEWAAICGAMDQLGAR